MEEQRQSILAFGLTLAFLCFIQVVVQTTVDGSGSQSFSTGVQVIKMSQRILQQSPQMRAAEASEVQQPVQSKQHPTDHIFMFKYKTQFSRLYLVFYKMLTV